MSDRNESASARGNSRTARSYADKLKGGGDGEPAELDGADVGALSVIEGNALGNPLVKRGMTLDEAQALMRELAEPGAYSMSPQFISLKAGDVVRGVIVEVGKMEITDIVTKQPKDVGTWTLEDGNGFRARFLTTHQLDQELNSVNPDTGEVVPKLGAYVIIAKLDDEKLPGGRVVGRFRIAIKKATPENVAGAGVEKAGGGK